jgi:hypothetical protein
MIGHAPTRPTCTRLEPNLVRRWIGAAPTRSDARGVAPRVPGAAPNGAALHSLLRRLPALAGDGERDDARSAQGGEKCFVDYSGKTPSYVDPQTGQRVVVQLFVAVLGASNFTYAQATLR